MTIMSRLFAILIVATVLVGFASPRAKAQTWHVHGDGVSLTITLLPTDPGVPPIASITGNVNGKPVGGVGIVRIGGNGYWSVNAILEPLERPELPGEIPPPKPKKQDPPRKPWGGKINGNPANENV